MKWQKCLQVSIHTFLVIIINPISPICLSSMSRCDPLFIQGNSHNAMFGVCETQVVTSIYILVSL